MNDENLMFPGDNLSTEEEFVSSRNTFIDNGNIRASIIGRTIIENGSIMVEGISREIKSFYRGMYVLGEITDDLHTIVFVKIDNFKKDKDVYISFKSGKIIMKSHAPSPRQQRNRDSEGNKMENKPFGVGDIILARITFDDKDVYTLDCGSTDLGVVYSKCALCDALLMLNNDKTSLHCSNCEIDIGKKISSMYNNSVAVEEFLYKNNR